MAMSALQGIESLKPKKKKLVKPAPAIVADPLEKVASDTAQQRPVRTPRTTTVEVQKRVSTLISGEMISDDGKLGKSIETQSRRQDVTAWMLNGHTYEGELCDVTMLAEKLNVPKRTIDTDIIKIKERMAEFYTKDDDTRDIAALAHMLLEMKFRDRGQAILLYNRVLADLARADEESAKRKKENRFSKLDGFGELSGRDRAAMYSTALAAIDLANRTTNGMESLLKLTGGAQKLQLIIKAKNVQLNKGNGTMNFEPLTIQAMINDMMGSVLPSNRGQNSNIALPAGLQLDSEDERILAIPRQEKGAKKTDAKS